MNKYIILIIIVTQKIFIGQVNDIQLPKIPVVRLKPYAKMASPHIVEASDLIKSRLWSNVYWTHNDSGDKARIFPLRRDGTIIKPDWAQNYQGIIIPDAVNVDWEAITTDDQGNLIIGDCGNNSNTRRDLALYIIREPYPSETVITRVIKRIFFFYPDQKEIPPGKKNFDAEALFWLKGKIYILTKHQSDTYTKLYCIDNIDSTTEAELILLEKFNTHSPVTGADISIDGSKLVILTTNSIWLFERDPSTTKFFSGKISWLPIDAKKIEAICLDGDKMLICNEEGELFELSLSELKIISE